MQKNLDLFREEQLSGLLLTSDCIVLSLHPKAWNLITSGQKYFEFRRRFRRRRTLAFIYVTLPEKVIKGAVLLGEPIAGSAAEIAKIAEQAIPGNGPSVYDYFIEKDFGPAMPIQKVYDVEPISLDEMRKSFGFVAPQFYLLLEKKPELLRLLIEKSDNNLSKILSD